MMSKNRVVDYVVKFSGEYHTTFATLGEARKYIRDLPVMLGITNMPNEVQLVKRTEMIEVLDSYSLKTKVVLEADEVFDNLELA